MRTSEEIIAAIKSDLPAAEDYFDGWEVVNFSRLGVAHETTYRTGDRRRWGEIVWEIVRTNEATDDRWFAISVYEGATEMQESFVEDVFEIEPYQEIVTTYRKKVKP